MKITAIIICSFFIGILLYQAAKELIGEPIKTKLISRDTILTCPNSNESVATVTTDIYTGDKLQHFNFIGTKRPIIAGVPIGFYCGENKGTMDWISGVKYVKGTATATHDTKFHTATGWKP